MVARHVRPGGWWVKAGAGKGKVQCSIRYKATAKGKVVQYGRITSCCKVGKVAVESKATS